MEAFQSRLEASVFADASRSRPQDVIVVNDEELFYQPLKPGQIRVLKSLSSNELDFRLVHVNLKDKPKFSALSYTWGSDKLCRSIRLNGNTFHITESLDVALRQFLAGIQSTSAKQPLERLLWIDAICINQNQSTKATRERSVQVQMMAMIYESAETVFAWLGPAKDIHQNHAAGQKLEMLGSTSLKARAKKQFPSYRPWWWPQKPLDGLGLELDIFRVMGNAEAVAWTTPNDPTQDAWHGIVHMFSSPWWTRAWTVQEGTRPEPSNTLFLKGMTPKAPKAKVIFVSGDISTTWYQISTARLTANILIENNVPGVEILKGSAKYVYRLSRVRRWRSSAEPVSMLDGLQALRLASCKDPRDKIYAVLGLLPTVTARLVPDYEKPVLQVYQEVVEHILNSRESGLDVLGYTCKVDKADNGVAPPFPGVDWDMLPSWAPNWHLHFSIRPLPKQLHLQADVSKTRAIAPIDRRMTVKPHTTRIVPAYNACGSFEVLDATVNGRCLLSSGMHVDTVSETMRFQWDAATRTATVTRWKSQLSKSTYPLGPDFDRALSQVHCADVKYRLIPESTPVQRGYQIDNKILVAAEGTLSPGELAERAAMLETFQMTTGQRALCLTHGGRLALVPYSSRPGDRICMLFGGIVFYVLRPKSAGGTTHEYIGEAYLHGMMDGEISNMVDRGEFGVQRFEIE